MDDEALDNTAAASAIELESSASKASDRGRLIAAAEEEEELFPANRSDWAARWQHPLVKSIQVRRGKAFRA
jgi:hypothetical protein